MSVFANPEWKRGAHFFTMEGSVPEVYVRAAGRAFTLLPPKKECQKNPKNPNIGGKKRCNMIMIVHRIPKRTAANSTIYCQGTVQGGTGERGACVRTVTHSFVSVTSCNPNHAARLIHIFH